MYDKLVNTVKYQKKTAAESRKRVLFLFEKLTFFYLCPKTFPPDCKQFFCFWNKFTKFGSVYDTELKSLWKKKTTVNQNKRENECHMNFYNKLVSLRRFAKLNFQKNKD